MANSLYQALGGIQPQQPSIQAPAASAAPGAGSLYKDLLPPEQPMAPGSEPLQMGPMIAQGDAPKMPFYYTPGQHPQKPPVQGASGINSLPSDAANFFGRMKK